MPRLSSTGAALMGTAGGVMSIDGSTPSGFTGLPSGYLGWLDPATVFGQVNTGGGVACYTSASPYTTLVQVDPRGANYTIAGNGNWAAWLYPGPGVFTSGLGDFPLGYALAASFQGEIALLASYAAGSGIQVYGATGALLDTISGTVFPSLPPNSSLVIRDGICSYNVGGGYLLRDYLARTNLSVLLRSDAGNWQVPVADGADIWVLERTNVSSLQIRKKDVTTAWVIEPSTPTIFGPDVMRLSAGVVRIAWSTTNAEAPADLIVVDLTLATGANTRGVVVSGSLVFTPQAALSPVTVHGTLSPGGGGGGGGGSSPTSPGRNVLDKRVAPPPPVKTPRRYPHVDQIQDWAAKQSAHLAWDQLGHHREAITQLQATADAQAKTIAQLQADLDQLKRTP